MNKYTRLLLIVCTSMLLYFFILACNLYSKVIKYKGLYETQLQNIEAYEQELGTVNHKNIEYQFTIKELKNSKDSINQKLAAVLKELKLKDKNIQYIQYQSSTITSTDTIIIKDTIFKDVSLSYDTLVTDDWYNLNLKLQYPSTIIVTPQFISEKYVIANYKKEYINEPSKFFFIRWFQKKKKVLYIDVEEKSPYIKENTNRFIKVIK